MNFCKIIRPLCWLTVFALSVVRAEEPARHELAEVGGRTLSVVTELDPYYSNVGFYFSPQNEEHPFVDSGDELEIYRDLFARSYAPRDVVLEASIYPMPIAGYLIRERAPDFYEQMQFSDQFNLVKSVTLGFDEPFAVSLFLGSVVRYRDRELPEVGRNMGYIGYLFSAGSKHLKDNMLVDDEWGEFEWKVKGDRDIESIKHSWSFRAGAKWHRNEDITDTWYLGLRRSHLDFNAPVLSWLLNSGFDYQIAFSMDRQQLVEQKLFLDKKLPLRAWRLALDLKVGFIWKQAAKYSGALASEGPGDEFYLVLRPDIDF